MGNIFSASEIVEIGIQIEKNGRDYYNALANKLKETSASGVFEFLAGEEARHIKAFEGILSKVEKYEPQGPDADEYSAYMKSLAAEHVFTQRNKGIEIANTIKDKEEAIQKSIGFEEDSIVFYEGMKKIVPQYDQKVVDELIRQEQRHLKQLIELKSKL